MIWLNLITDKQFNKQLFSVTLPIALQFLVFSLLPISDAFMLSSVSQDSMAAVSLASQMAFIQILFLIGVVVGISILGAQYWGKKDKVTLERILALGTRETAIVSILFFVGYYWWPEKLMRIYTNDELLISIGAKYLHIVSWSYLLEGFPMCYTTILRVCNRVSLSTAISTTIVFVNIAFNAIFIFGMLGVPAMGVRGAAIATNISRVIEVLICLILSRRPNYIHLKIKEIFILRKDLIIHFWHYSWPLLSSSLLWGIGFSSYSAIMGRLGRDAVAANTVTAVARDVVCCFATGLSQGVAIIIGHNLGAGKLELAKEQGDKSIAISFVLGIISAGLVLLLIPVVSSYMTLTEQAHQYMVGMFHITSVYMIGCCVCSIAIDGIFNSGGDTVFNTVSLFVCMWCVAIPVAFLGAFYFHWSVLVVYACVCLDEIGKIPWVLVHYRKYKWLKNITKECGNK